MSYIILTDAQISELIAEPKNTPHGLGSPVMTMPERNGHKHKEFDVECNSDNKFIIRIRQLCANPLDFSVILAYQLPGLHSYFRLRRYNGQHAGIYSNVVEREKISGFHIHMATERYQTAGLKPDAFAVATNKFFDLSSAILSLLNDCGFRSPIDESPLFVGRIK